MTDLSKNSENRLPVELSESEMQNVLFIETLDYMLKVIYKNYSSDIVNQLVNWYLTKNKYEYDQAKKQLFSDLASQLKKSLEEISTQS